MLGPGFETFPTQFHFNISQMRQPSFQESALTKLSNQIDWKDFNEKLRFFLSRAFKADHNVLTELPYDFSQLLKKFDTKNVTLGHNQWMCSCHAEITGRGLQRKIQDQQEVSFFV